MITLSSVTHKASSQKQLTHSLSDHGIPPQVFKRGSHRPGFFVSAPCTDEDFGTGHTARHVAVRPVFWYSQKLSLLFSCAVVLESSY